MAVPTGQQPAPVPNRLIWLRRLGASIGRPVFAVVLAMVAGIIIIMITSPGSPGDRFTEPIKPFFPALLAACRVSRLLWSMSPRSFLQVFLWQSPFVPGFSTLEPKA